MMIFEITASDYTMVLVERNYVNAKRRAQTMCPFELTNANTSISKLSSCPSTSIPRIVAIERPVEPSMSREEYQTFLEKFDLEWAVTESIGIRRGQQAFITLSQSHSKVAERIRGTVFDPFYKDSRILAFLNTLIAFFVRDNDE